MDDDRSDTNTETVQVRPFADWLREQRRGALHDELSEELRKLVMACQTTGKAGSLHLKLTLTPSDASLFAHLEVTDDVSVKEPKPPRPASIFYPDENANLVRNDPRQQRLGLRDARDVDLSTGEIRDAR